MPTGSLSINKKSRGIKMKNCFGDDMFGFLHRHPKMEAEHKIDGDHVIVDFGDWVQARKDSKLFQGTKCFFGFHTPMSTSSVDHKGTITHRCTWCKKEYYEKAL
jgi:hypothetical protein